MTQNRYYSNTAAQTTLANTSGMNTVETDLSLTSTTGWPTTFPFLARVEPDTANEELMLVTSGSGSLATPYTVTRAFDGTSAKTHAHNVTVVHGFAQIDLAEPQQHINQTTSSSGAHGLPASTWGGGTVQLINHSTLSASGTFIFSSIPNTFNHLRLVVVGTSTDSGGNGFSDICLQFNSATGTAYSYSYTNIVNATSFVGTSVAATSSIHAGFVNNGSGNPTTSAGNGVSVIELPLYATTFSKTVTFISRASSGVGSPNNYNSGTGGGIWGNNTAAINSIKIFPAVSPNTFATGSQAWLYGIL